MEILVWEAGAAALQLPELGAWIFGDEGTFEALVARPAHSSLRGRVLAARCLEVCARGLPPHAPQPGGGARMRVVFVARPAGDGAPRAEPNEHSLEARWVALEEMDALALRGEEVRGLARYVLEGGAVYPLSVLTDEGAPYP